MSTSSAASAGPSRARMNIGEVLDQLRPDFPGVTIPKIRFLEDKGLIKPERTPAGYRKFSHADVDRLRYVLRMQRDHYLPLKVIGEHLDAIDRGLEPPPIDSVVPTVPKVALAADGLPSSASFARRDDLRLSRRELIKIADISEDLLDQLEQFGLVTARPGTGHFDSDALVIVKTARELADFGFEPRHLRAFKTAADREVGLVEQVVAPHKRGRDAAARARAEGDLRDGRHDGVDRRRLEAAVDGVEVLADDLQREIVVALHAQHVPQPVDVRVGELAVARRSPFRLDEPLVLQEPDLRDRHAGVVRTQGVEDLPDVEAYAGRAPGDRRSA